MDSKEQEEIGMKLRKRGYLVEAVWEDIEDVSGVVDTRNPNRDDSYTLGNAAVLRGDRLIGWHITDDSSVIRSLKKKSGSVIKSYGPRGGRAELGPGLYVSAVPHLWSGRSTDKWGFLSKLSKEDLNKLTDQLLKDLRNSGRIADFELERAERDINYVRQGVMSASSLVLLAGQPYVIPFWKDSYLSKIGLKASKSPTIVEVEFVGKYARISTSKASHSTLRTLRRGGFDGAFISDGFVGVPQLVIWNTKAIKKIGPDEEYKG